MEYLLERIVAMAEVCGNDVGLALDCGPGMMVQDARKLAQAVEGLNIAWLEDMVTGDYTVSATMPSNYIAFEYPRADPEWWYDIVNGLPDPIVRDSHIDVWDRPGLGVEFRVDAARKYLPEGDEDFFD
jgi:L-alanine-DL-glutamate epimerase-like enolase superfamily enzyme